MHVLILPSWYSTPEAPWNGIFFENQAVALARAGARVGLAFVEPRGLRHLSPAKIRESHFQVVCSQERGVTVVRMKGWNTAVQTAAGASIWSALSNRLAARYVRRFGAPDVIHAQGALWAGGVAVGLGQRLSRPSVVTEHSSAILIGALRQDQRKRAAAVYREANAVLAVSRALSAAVDAIAGTNRCRVVPNLVDFEFFTLPPVPRSNSPFTFLSVCNLVGNKNVDRLIRAFARSSNRRTGTRLVIVGAGPEEQALRALADECRVATRVEFVGGMPAEGVRERLWTANALVLPSAFETFGVVLVEALATGIPVISTRCGGPEDIVEPNMGFLVDRDDEGELADAMVAVASQPFSDRQLREHARSRFSFDNVAQNLLGVYAQLINGGGREAAVRPSP